jgi:uncharacterized repeat protein (TIGR03803 family)
MGLQLRTKWKKSLVIMEEAMSSSWIRNSVMILVFAVFAGVTVAQQARPKVAIKTFRNPSNYSRSTIGDGNDFYAGLLLGKDGYLYGTTYYGGTSVYFGTVFRLNAPSM